MACCLTAPSHYQNQCWLTIKGDLWHSLESNFTRSPGEINPQHVFRNYTFEITSTSPRDGLKWFMMMSSNGNIFRITGPLCGEFTGHGEFPTQRPVTQSFDVFFDLNKRLSKQPWGWWFETPSWSLWRQCNVSTLRQRQNDRLFADDIFKRIFLNGNIKISNKISLKFVPTGLINNIPTLVLIMAWRLPGDKPLFEPMMVRSLTHICVTRPQSVKLITFAWPSRNVYIFRWTEPSLV